MLSGFLSTTHYVLSLLRPGWVSQKHAKSFSLLGDLLMSSSWLTEEFYFPTMNISVKSILFVFVVMNEWNVFCRKSLGSTGWWNHTLNLLLVYFQLRKTIDAKVAMPNSNKVLSGTLQNGFTCALKSFRSQKLLD